MYKALVITNNRLKINGKVENVDYEYHDEHDGISILESVINSKPFDYYVLDYETDGLCPINNSPLLALLLVNDNLFIIDLLSVTNFRQMLELLTKKGRLANQNCKFEYTFTKSNFRMELDIGFDTMIAFQRTLLNLHYQENDLHSIIKHLLGIELSHLSHLTTSFMVTVPLGHISAEQFDYCINDLIHIPALITKLTEIIKFNENETLVYDIEFPYISILGDMELEGIDVNKEKHAIYTEKAIANVKILEEKLDTEFHRLRDLLRPELVGGKYDRTRKTVDIVQYDMFGDDKKSTYSNTKVCINWNSDKQLIEILGLLNLICPLKNEKISETVPEFNTLGLFTTNEAVLNEFIAANPDIEHKVLLNLVLEYRGYLKTVSTYGYSFINNVNIKTNKLHTTYRQCATRNGRVSSGGGKQLPTKPNLQNLPRDAEFRSFLTAPLNSKYKLFTADYSGAELCVIVSKSRDYNLYKLSLTDDLHSPIATACWRNIYAYQGDKFNYENFIVDKKNNANLRQVGKNMHFGFFYLMGVSQASKTLGVSNELAEIYSLTVRKMFPNVFSMMEKVVNSALQTGILEIDHVTKAKIYFPSVLNAIKNGIKLTYEEEKNVRGQAVNIPISGTQAIFLKHATVELNKFYKENKIDAKFLLTVHDELVIKYNVEQEKEFVEPSLKIMRDTADKYLNGLNIKVDYNLNNCWAK